jgi:hypothetical protein
MDKTRILQQGEEAKFKIEIADFSMEDNEFSVQLSWGYRRNVMTIEKNQMFQGPDGKWYFVFDTDDMSRRVTALCTWRVPDSDCDDGFREETNEQYLCFVATTPCPKFVCCPSCDDSDQPVTYTRTEISSIADSYAYLETSEGDKIISCDNEIILVLKEEVTE